MPVAKKAPAKKAPAKKAPAKKARKATIGKKEGNEQVYTVPARFARSEYVGGAIDILPAFGPEGRNPRQGSPLSTHGGVAFEVLRALSAEIGSLTVPFNAYIERLDAPETYPNVSIRTGGNGAFRELKHIICDRKNGRVVLRRSGE
jgi:hypothetical protein